MATTQNTYTGNGSTTNYTFSFEYIAQSDVKVTLDTVATTAYTFANATTLSFTTAPANGVAIRIYRDTNIDNLQSTFFPGSAIKAEDLNNNFTQSHFAVQETDNEVITANTTASSAVTTANSAVTTANSAVTTANLADTKSDAAVATANTASTTAGSAVTTANAATTTANSASSAAASAVSTANAADTKADTAISTANTASSNASTAVSTANSANTAAANAVTTADAATVTANNATTTANSAVTTANTANTNATAAQSAATTAQASATAAQTSATAAQTSATAAQAQATLAADVRNAFTITDSNSDGTFDFVVGDIPIKGNNGVKLPFESVTYAEEGAIRYNNSLDKIELYNGAGQWVTAAGGAAVSSSPPSLPSAGDVWYDHDNGRAYVYYNDGDSNQWVEMNPSWNGYVADNSISSAKIIDGAIVNADVNASAAIAGTKISPDFGSQNVLTTGSAEFAGGFDASSTTNQGLKIDANGAIFNQRTSTISTLFGGYLQNSQTVKIAADGSAYFASNVGIGESSPSTKTHIKGNWVSNTGQLKIDANSGQTYAGISLANNGAHKALVYHNNSSNLLYIGTSTSGGATTFNNITGEVARIDSSGRLLVGTTSDTSAARAVIQGLSSDVNAQGVLDIRRGTRPTAADTEIGSIRFKSIAGDGRYAQISAFSDGASGSDSDTPGSLRFSTTPDGSSGATERLRIDSSGNFGFNNNNPQYGLHVKSNSSLSSQRIDLHMTNDTTGHGSSDGVQFGYQNILGAYIWNFEATPIYFGTNSTERMRIDSSGNVFIGGTTAASADIALNADGSAEFAGDVYADKQFRTQNGYGAADSSTSGLAILNTNGTATALINYDGSAAFNGSISLGTTSPAQIRRNQVAGSYGLMLQGNASNALNDTNPGAYINIGGGSLTDGYEGNINLVAYGNTAGGNRNNITFSTRTGVNTVGERMRLDSSGSLLIGRTAVNSNEKLSVKYAPANRGMVIDTSTTFAGNSNLIEFRANGVIGGSITFTNNGTSTAYVGSSDYRMKENVVDLTDAVERVKNLQPRRFNFIASPDTIVDGFLAHEAQTVVPEAVTGTKDEVDDDGNAVMQGIDQAKLVPLLTAALQEAIAKIETLEAKVNALEGA